MIAKLKVSEGFNQKSLRFSILPFVLQLWENRAKKMPLAVHFAVRQKLSCLRVNQFHLIGNAHETFFFRNAFALLRGLRFIADKYRRYG